jgi:ferredoxin--NADP+ reductase
MSRWVEGRVVRLQPWTDKLYSIQVEAEIARFVAGQFTRLALEIDGEVVGRPYSFLNSPRDPLHEFYFVTVPGGPLTSRMITLAPGDPILIARQAAGFFTLNELPDAGVLWMLSTGTAIGPFLSILANGEVWRSYSLRQPRGHRFRHKGPGAGGDRVRLAGATRRPDDCC